MKRTYKNDKIIVHWDSRKCIHAGECDGRLPQVFNPQRRPWIEIDAANVEDIKRTIDRCPSGALTYETPCDQKTEETRVQIMKDGPCKITGKFQLVRASGDVIPTSDTVSLCRCGASGNMPFCDGSHKRVNFHG